MAEIPTDLFTSSSQGILTKGPAGSSGWRSGAVDLMRTIGPSGRNGGMPRVLLTGSSGGAGRVTRRALEEAGWSVSPFDLAEGLDLRDFGAVLEGMRGCEQVIHAGAIAHDSAGSPDEIVTTNVLGTWHVLLAAEQLGVSKVVYFSSGQVFGFAEGEGQPAYLPVDDDHPTRASRPYGMSKRLAEEMCSAWTKRTGIPTVVLRPVMILDDEALRTATREAAELGAFVHVEDVAMAVKLSLTAVGEGHHRLILCGPGPFATSAASALLGWQASRGWSQSDPM